MRKPYALGGRAGFIVIVVVVTSLAASMAHAGEVARGDLAIVGLGLEVERDPVITAVDVPSYVQTFFGGKAGGEAPPAPGLSALGELTGPGIDAPITLAAVPGQKFAIPALHEKGEYTLQNIRLAGAGGEFLQQAVPSFAIIQVTDVLQTRVKVRQLTPDELRERGIFIDERNYEVYEYTFIFGVEGSEVEVPYPVMIDRRTREIVPLKRDGFAMLPFPKLSKPPRFTPPQFQPFDLIPGGRDVPDGGREKEVQPEGVSLPAALVVPTGFGVLHQFFAVVLQVSNAAPDGSNIRLDSISARIQSPLTMRVAKVIPAVALGQPVPIVDETTGATFLVAGAQGNAEWTLEALKTGTHTIDIDVQATYQKPGQEDFHLGGRASTSIVVSDPRFHVNFSHPDVVRKDDKYTAFAFVTNLSSQRQHVFLDLSEIPACSSGSHANNICRYEGADVVELDIEPGAMATVPHKLISRVTGHVYAGAGAANDEAVGVSVRLFMGVSESGIPLSPATLVMPYHARFLPTEFVDANLQLLGLGYSLATAPLTTITARKPRVITTDVFRRAQQIALAGHRVFSIRRERDTNDPVENRDPFVHLSLDLLGNVERVDLENLMPELAEYDELRRQEEAGRIAGAAMARQLETNNMTQSADQFVDDFAAATSHRTPFLFAYVHGASVAGNARPYAMSVQGLSTLGAMDVPAEAAGGWVRSLAYGELTRFDTGSEEGELALVGRWTENLRVSVIPATGTFTLDLLYPDTDSGRTLRTKIAIQGAQAGVPVTVDVVRGARNLVVRGAIAVPLVDPVPQAPLRVLGAAQDLHLDGAGHVVGVLFNRPVTVAESTKLRDLLALTIDIPSADYTATRRNDLTDPDAELQIPAAVLQEDARIALITFDKTLSKNAGYIIAVEQIRDRLQNGVTFAAADIVPRVDNDRPAGILTGKVLLGDGTPAPGILVRMTNPNYIDANGRILGLVQYDVADANGRYLFEYVPRDLDRGLLGNYTLIAETRDGKQASLKGSVRLPGEVHFANLVFLGRGTARGQLRWEDGEPIPDWKVSGGSPLFGGMAEVRTDAGGNFEIANLPVGPVVLNTVDPDGRMLYATTAIRTAGEVVTQDLVAVRKEGPPPGVATVRVLVLRSDTMQPVAGAQVGVGSPQVPLWSAETDLSGRYEFRGVPAGLTSIIAADFSISRHGAAVEVELRGDQVLEQTLVLQVGDPTVKYAVLQGVVTRDDPAAPGDVSKDQIVPGAILSVYGMPAVTANPDGSYVFPEIPLAYAGKSIRVYDPATTREGWFRIPTLVEGVNHFPIRLRSLDPFGRATYRVRLYGAKGEPIAGERVFIPGFPPTHFGEKGNGVYELDDIRVPQSETVWAVTSEDGPYGEQYVSGNARVDFGGQIGITDLRLPGIGTVVVSLEIDGCSEPSCAVGRVSMTYMVWNDYLQKIEPKTITGDSDPTTGLITFHKVPARQTIRFATDRHPAGYDDEQVYLAYDGEARQVTLRLKTIGNVTGRVLAHDGITPIAGATVRIKTGTAVYAPSTTKPDGSFLFAGIPANVQFDIVAEIDQDGIFRTGTVHGKTPTAGGPVEDLLIVMREQSDIEGRVVMNDDGAAVPLAYYWLRELAWPYRRIGSPLEPLQADINGRFVVGNVFAGPFRLTAVAPDNQELRGDYQGEILAEGDVSQHGIEVRIGGAGVGTVAVTVVDPLLGFEPVPNAEVALRRAGKMFDFTTTNDAGIAYFEEVPAGTGYSAVVFSKQRGRSGQSSSFTVVTGDTASVSVHLDFLGVVSGSLTDPDADPPNLPVRGQPVTYRGNNISLRATTDTNGNFEMNGVPEGAFTLSAWELSTQRIATGPAGLFISKLVPEQRNIQLQLERMGTLTVKVHLPNDSGGAGELVPLAEVTAKQCTICNVNSQDYPYYRGAQGNPLVFPRMFTRVGYALEVRELGGEARVVRTSGKFPAGALAHEHVIVLPPSGTVEVLVLDGTGQPVSDAEVRIGGARSATVYTGPDGLIALPALPFGWYSASARKLNVTAAGSGELKSRSTPLRLTLNLGTNATVTGSVEAEEGIGQPSVSTRVILTVKTSLLPGGLRMETFTDANGVYTFTGIPIGNTTLDFLFAGPDDTTTVSPLPTISVPNGTTGTIQVPPVKLDATPPRVLSIDPPANSTNVSPTSDITVTFSEPIQAAFVNSGYFILVPTDDDHQTPVQTVVTGSVRPGQTYAVKVDPVERLRSNVLYRFAVKDGIKDAAGLKLAIGVGTSFKTVDYTEPAVVKITPPVTEALPQQATFKVKFNKAVDIRSFDAGNGGMAKLEKLDAPNGTVVGAPLPISVPQLDVLDPSTIVFAPQGVAIEESSFYRVSVSGVRDTVDPPNVQNGTAVFDYFSFDTKKPLVTIVSPVAAGENLVSGVLYSARVAVTDEGSGADSTDVAYVDWLDAGGVSIKRVKTAPFAYDFVAPTTTTGTTFTLKATATDLSNNTSPEPATFTWEVAPNVAPAGITVSHDVQSVYPSKPVETRVRFTDEGVAVTVVLELRGTALDGTELRQVLGSKNVTRPSSAVEFPEVVFNWTAPLGLKDGTAIVVATATDSVNNSATGEGAIAILLDQTLPELVSFLPAAESRYKFGVNGSYTIELQVKDLETGIARAVFTVNGAEVFNATSGTYNATTGVTTFKKVVSVPPKNADTRVPVVVTAYDHRGNLASDTHEVIYERVDDESLPRAWWLTPLDGAALPSNVAGWQTTLRVKATDDVKVTSVRFTSAALAAPIELTVPKSGTTDVFETKAALAFPPDGSPFTITATVADGDPSHDVELPITIDPIVANPIVSGDINITNLTASQYENKSVVVRGNVRVYVSVPLTLKDLMLVDGALLSVPEETRLDLTITDRLFVDGDSRIDVSERGWLGGLRTREDNSFTNPSRSGRTIGATSGATFGATNADGSHAGIGGGSYGATNATYGSITDPIDFGGGGAAQPSGGNRPGANGGGALSIEGGAGLARFVLAGPVRANGGNSSASIWRAAAGGSIDLRSRALVTSPVTRITANGGDSGASNEVDLGGGGGRVAVRVSERFDVDPDTPLLQARGGRNTGAESAAYVEGGAGTIFLARPSSTLGDLIVSSFDERYASTTHRTNGTPLAGALAFDAITVGPRALARFDVEIPANVTADATAMVIGPADVPTIAIGATTPAAGSDVPQDASIATSFTAASVAGVREVRTILSAQPADVVAYPKFAADVPSTPTAIAVPHTATTGPVTLKLRVLDRSGRFAETEPVAFNVVTNTPAVVDQFDVTPNGEVYANTTLAVTAAAHDDVAVTALTLTSTVGTVASQAAATPTPLSMTRAFTVAIPPATPSNTTVVLTLAASDDFPGRVATTQQQALTIKRDTIAPSLAIVSPAASQQYAESSGAQFAVSVDASDDEVAVKRVVATVEGVEYELSLASGARWTRNVPLPNVDGTEPVAKSVVVRAYDFEDNVTTRDVAFFVVPLIDPNAPALSWVCSSPGAMYPPGYEITFQVNAVPNSAENGVKSVHLTLGNAAPVALARVGTTNVWEAKTSIPAGTADGTILDVRIVALSISDNESTLAGSVTAVSGVTINTTSTIAANDAAFENQSVIVGAGGTLTITGAHTLKNLAVLSGGKVVQQHVNKLSADELRVDRFYLGCGATIDVTGLGLAYNTAYPGAGVPDTAGGGSHIGRGGVWDRTAGGAFDSVFEPKAPGGGGNNPKVTVPAGTGFGGGSVRIHASGTVAVDGTIVANGKTSSHGAGAGGSIWITSGGAFAGNGTLQAIGANTPYGGPGGGGAIALHYATSSATLTTSVRGGTSGNDPARHAAAGTVLRRATGTDGDLTVDNTGVTISTTSATELPAFGSATVVAASAGNVVLAELAHVSPSLAGHRVRAYAPDGTERGLYRIASVTPPATTVTFDGGVDVRTQDSVDYTGYLLYAPNGLGGKKFVAVRRNGTQWQYDSDSAFVAFVPGPGDALFASFTKSGNKFRRMEPLRCCDPVEGLPVLELVGGEIVPGAANWTSGDGPNTAIWRSDDGEIYLDHDGRRRAFLLVSGPPSLSLETISGADVQPGDRLRGVYRFDRVTLVNARVVSEDLVEIANPLQKDAASSLAGGNAAAPVVDPSKIAIERGLNGWVVRGAAGAVTDGDGPLDVVVRNAASPSAAPPLLRAAYAAAGAEGGLSVVHVENARTSGNATTIVPMSEGYVSFSPSQTNANVQVGLVPNDTTWGYAEPGHQSFRLRNNATYEIWANGSNTNKSGSYAANTAFRIEKSATALRWFVDGVAVHEITTGLPATLLFDASWEQASSGEIAAIEVVDALPARRIHAKVASDGSFRMAVTGAPGDELLLRARDRHRDSLVSDELSVGTLADDLGVASVTFDPATLVGGDPTTGTVTLRAPAGDEGALVTLQSGNAVAAVPPTITVAPGAISGTFAVTTTPLTADTDVTIAAWYGGFGSSGVLHVLRDNVAPDVTITEPAASAEYTEGQSAKINVRATIADGDTGVKRAWAELAGQSFDMTLAAGVWSAQLPVPFVEGSVDVPFDVLVHAEDFGGNVGVSARSIIVHPVVDATSPSISWKCGSGEMSLPVGYDAQLSVLAMPPNAENPIAKVEFTITAPGGVGTTYLANDLGGGVWAIAFPVPDAPDGSLYTVHVLATTASGTSAFVDGGVRVVKGAMEIRTNTTIGASTTTYDNQSVVIWEGATVTIDGAHSFQHLIVLGKLTHPTLKQVDVNATTLYVSCTGAIDVTGLGYDNTTRYPGIGAVGTGTGGGRIGRGGDAGAGFTFGSVHRPAEAGGGASSNARGGGVVRVAAQSVAVDGAIRANGALLGGAGGSVWIAATRVSGNGSIEANGGDDCEAGGGGALAIEYADPTSSVPSLRAHAGAVINVSQCGGFVGGPGTMHVTTPAAPFGNVTIDSSGFGAGITELPAFGSGTAQSGSAGATLVTGRSKDIQPFFVGHWVRITAMDGTVKGTWRIGSIPATRSVTLVPNGGEAIDIAAGDAWQGVYRFDTLTIVDDVVLESADPIETTTQTISAIVATDRIESENLRLISRAVLKHRDPNPQPHSLTIEVTNEIRVDEGAAIDVTGLGYDNTTRYPGIAAVGTGTGGSRIGRGGDASADFTFGSVERPAEAGGGASSNARGGGVVRITAPSVIVDGAIRANGALLGGAGGSVWITATRISGIGSIDANGGDDCEAGGGGALSIDYTDPESRVPALHARAGAVINTSQCGGFAGGPGTMRVSTPDSPLGNVTIDSEGFGAGITELPSFGNGTAQTNSVGGTLVTDRATDIQAFFIGHWVRIAAADGTVKGTWRIGSIPAARTATLVPNDAETIDIVPGDQWRGLYRFDSLAILGGATLVSNDPVETANGGTQ